MERGPTNDVDRYRAPFREWLAARWPDAEALAGRDILAGQLAGPGWETVNLAFLLGGGRPCGG